MTTAAFSDEHVDDHVDTEIARCLSARPPVSFFMFAGAGSGKTRSLITALVAIRKQSGDSMRLHGQQVAVITYTNAACDEIKARLEFDPLVSVSTIHSFVWELIQGFTIDIRKWLKDNLAIEIAELQAAELKGRAGKASTTRKRSIEAKNNRLQLLPSIKRFVYSPTGDNRSRDSLNHAEVIKLGAYFVGHKPLMQQLVVNRFPVLLIDESQDTNGLLMDAFLSLQAAHRQSIALGLFGDTMQRIYTDGKLDLDRSVPADWATPAKSMNHRCPKRVVRLINKVRSSVDTQIQSARTDAAEGHARLFICSSGNNNKFAVEEKARNRMADVTGDPLWKDSVNVKTLILEHQMAARRMSFLEMYQPLYKFEGFKTGLRDGSLPALSFFSDQILPLVRAQASRNSFASAAILKKYSPHLGKKTLLEAGEKQIEQIAIARSAVDELMKLFSPGRTVSFVEVLKSVASSCLFEIPGSLYPFTSDAAQTGSMTHDTFQDQESASERLAALEAFLAAPFQQIEAYSAYVAGRAPFDTHQGVKGLEFPRVMVVMDDENAGASFFSYEKLFGTAAKTKADIENERAGKETSLDRTRRLFYVTCSRSQAGLALVAYSQNPDAVRSTVTAAGWFDSAEIENLD